MHLALKQARKARDLGEVPVGAIIVHRETSKIIASTHNLVEQSGLPIYHAEILALIKTSKKIGSKYLTDYDLYVTLEPCAACAAAISMFRIGRLFYGAMDIKFGAVDSASKFFSSHNCFFKPEIYSSICEEESATLMKDFFRKLR